MQPATLYPILRLGVDAADHSKFLRATQRNLRNGWRGAGDWPAFFAPQTRYVRYRQDRGAHERANTLYLLRTDPATLTVVSIRPNTGTLSLAERWAVLDDFRASVLHTPDTRSFPSVVVEPDSRPASLPPPKVQRLLDYWRGFLNNGAGFHPFDPSDWQDVLITLRLTGRCISFDWLINAFYLRFSMPANALVHLEEDFYSSMKLLERHDELRALKRKALQAGATCNDHPSTRS